MFNNTPDQTITHTLDYSNAGTVETPLTNPQIQSTNVSGIGQYGLAPLRNWNAVRGIAHFPKERGHSHRRNGDRPEGFDLQERLVTMQHTHQRTRTARFATGADHFIGVVDTFDVTAKPNDCGQGTTTALIEYRTDTIPSVTDWAPSGSAPNPACSNTLGTNTSTSPAGCDLLDILVNTYGDATTVSGTTKKKGTFASVYGVPMPLTNVSVNGTALNNPPSNNNNTSALWFKAPLNLSFTVNPACPLNMYPCSIDPGSFNYFSAAPVASESYLFTDLSGNPIGTTTQATPPSGFNTSSVAPVVFTATPALADGRYFLQFSAADNVGIVERHVQLITTAGATCPNPETPGTPTSVPCYQTTLFKSQVNLDSVPPAASCPAANGQWYAADLTFSCSASDVTSGIGTATGYDSRSSGNRRGFGVVWSTDHHGGGKRQRECIDEYRDVVRPGEQLH